MVDINTKCCRAVRAKCQSPSPGNVSVCTNENGKVACDKGAKTCNDLKESVKLMAKKQKIENLAQLKDEMNKKV